MDCIKETIKEGALLLEKMPELFRNGKNTVSVSYCDKLVCHRLGTFLGIKIPTGWTEPRMATKRDKLHVPTLGTGIHGAAIRRITTVNHLFNIFYLCGTWVKSVQDFFIMVGKDFLYYSHMFIHKLIMIQKQEKRKPLPLKIEGQGS